MKDLKYRFENNYLLGCIRYKGAYTIYLMPIAWWILNYKKYDPGYNPANWKDVYRGNILNVSTDAVDGFIKSIQADRVDITEFPAATRDSPVKYLRLRFFIDFDNNVFINGYYDNVELEEYLPDENWEGKVDDPNNYLPMNLQDIFQR